MKATAIQASLAISLLLAAQTQAQFYYPDNNVYATPEDSGLKYEAVAFTSGDGTKLVGWFVPAVGDPIGTVVHFHGNAQNMTAHFSFVSWLPKTGFNVFVFDYRGYGGSGGSAERAGIYEDGVAALRYIKSRKDIRQDSIFVLGQSLGGAVAVDAVASGAVAGIRAVVVESAFSSYKGVAKDKAPEMLVDLLVSDDHSPLPLVGRLSPAPFLVIHGTEDPVVPYQHGQLLFKAAGEPKTFWTIQGGKHVEAFTIHGQTYRPKLTQFLKDCLSTTDKPKPGTVGGKAP